MAENMEKTYELRGLEADDMFIMLNIISKIGVREFKACFESEEVRAAVSNMAKNGGDADEAQDGGDSVVSVGISVAFDVASIVLSNIGKCKNDIYELLARLSGMKAGDIAKLPMMTFTGMVVDLVKKEEFADFFQAAIKLLK